MSDAISQPSSYQGSAFWSYGFRPFFLSAAIFAGIAIPLWVFTLSGMEDVTFLFPPREWHVHEMVFGFLPCVMTGFLLTAIPNWTERPPMRGMPLFMLWALWLLGRAAIASAWLPPLLSAVVDCAFLVALASIVWREILTAKAWERIPIGVVISLYSSANFLFHGLYLSGASTAFAERMALTLIMVLLAMIAGKVTPNFTEDILGEQGVSRQPAPFSRFDGLSILLVLLAGVLWTINLNPSMTGMVFVGAGIIHLIRLSRWYGWYTWREPLVLILHIGYGWLAMSFLILGGSMLGIGLQPEDAIHALTTGAIGVMVLAIMTRATLGHTGRAKHAGGMTVMIYCLVNLGALLRVFGSSVGLTRDVSLVLSATCWSGAFLLFVLVYGHMIFGPDLDEEISSA